MQAAQTHGKVMTKGLCHVAIRVKDLDRSIRFYTDLFNLRVTDRSEDMAFMNTPDRPDSFALFRSNEEVRHGGDLYHFGFFVNDENYDRALKYIKENSINILGGPGQWSSGARFVYIEDPDGYRVQISTE